MFAKVIVDIAHAAVDKAFTYRVPDRLDILPGQHVLLPFGQGDHVKEGFVLSVTEESGLGSSVSVKDVLSCMEPYPVLLPEQIALAEWMQEALDGEPLLENTVGEGFAPLLAVFPQI